MKSKNGCENFDSGKELALYMNTRNLNSELRLVIVEPFARGWHEVKKKKAKKGRIDFFFKQN